MESLESVKLQQSHSLAVQHMHIHIHTCMHVYSHLQATQTQGGPNSQAPQALGGFHVSSTYVRDHLTKAAIECVHSQWTPPKYT